MPFFRIATYSEVILNIVDLTLNQQLFSDVGRPPSSVNLVNANYIYTLNLE